MINVEVKRSQFYMENTPEENDKYFYIKAQKFLHKIDTFYYSVSIIGDGNNNSAIKSLLEELNNIKSLHLQKKEEIEFVPGLFITSKRFSIYAYCLSVPDKYDIFISDYIPNLTTPRIVVQIRSNALWLLGEDVSINHSYTFISSILERYQLKAHKVYENRIDYAFHTNVIQSPLKFFGDKSIENYMVTNLEEYNKRGAIGKRGTKNRLTINYLALGQRKSNNVFVRIYNKAKEVIEEGYKGWFFDIWRSNGLISFYDEYCFKLAYINKNFDYLYHARLKFYLDYGHDQQAKREIQLLLNDKNVTYDAVKQLSDSLMPDNTTIMNIEFQTKRKFYYYADDLINGLHTVKALNSDLTRICKVIDNRSIFIDYLTDKTLSFRKFDSNEYMDWWKRLRSLKLKSFYTDTKYIRNYMAELDKLKLEKRIVNTIGTLALYNNNKDTNFIEDFSDFLSYLNDNDKVGFKLNLYNKETGECLRDLKSIKLENFTSYKEKRYTALRNRISSDNEI